MKKELKNGFSDAELRIIVQMHRQGDGADRIARRVGATRYGVIKAIEESGQRVRKSASKEWTEKELEVIRSMSAEGYSTKKIGEAFGVTKNVIIGVCHRRGIKLTKTTYRKFERDTAANAGLTYHKKPEFRLPKEIALNYVPKSSRAIGLLDLQDSDCRFPHDGPSGHVFCGQPAAPGASYCFDCLKVALAPIQKEEGEENATFCYFDDFTN